MVAMALISSCFSVVRSTASRPTGTIIAPPAPWRMRARVNAVRVWHRPQSIEAAVKTTMAPAKTVRRP